MFNMSEAQEFIATSALLNYPAEAKFRTNLSGEFRHSGTKFWLKAIKYLLCTYEIASARSALLDDLRNVIKLMQSCTRRSLKHGKTCDKTVIWRSQITTRPSRNF